MRQVGFIINSRIPATGRLFHGGLLPHHLLTGWDDAASAMSVMRFRWVAEELRRRRLADYELYKPWRKYDAVVFMKSMGPHCVTLARQLQRDGTKVVFEANVDYYTESHGEALPDAIAPSTQQRENAIAITRQADLVIASSRHLAEICEAYAADVHWVPDNVNENLVPSFRKPPVAYDGRLHLWWSGMAGKLFEFLAVEEALLPYADRLHLHLVTNSRDACKSWKPEMQARFDAFLHRLPHTFYRFHSVKNLMKLYAHGSGLIVSPRYLDSPYNFGHTEWKITLGMACGLPALASPVPSYQDVAQRAQSGAIRLASSTGEWSAALEDALAGRWNLVAGAEAARQVVHRYYATSKVALAHWEAVSTLFSLAA
jgi:glycosyltransferase involved in cell wall biosynthesis